MTIQVFSEKVGIAKSAIRYYESKGLLGSVERSASGYRLYREDQIETVRLITSLRMADIAIADIQMYLTEADNSKRQHMMGELDSQYSKTPRHIGYELALFGRQFIQ